MKKIMSLLLAVIMTFSMPCTAFATENTNSVVNERIEDAYVDISSFTEADISAVEMYTALNDQNEYYITDIIALQSVLDESEYELIEQQISIVNMNAGISTMASEDGSSSNPYELTDGTRKTVTASSVWFKCKIRGATDFSVTSGISGSTIKVYKKTLLGKTQLYSATGTSLTKTLSDCAINNNANTYLVNVEAPTSTSVGCRIKTHVDTTSSSKGALWKPKDTTAMYDTNILYMKYWYVDKTRVGKIRDMVTHADFLDAQSNVANGTLSLSMFLTGLGFEKTNLLLGIAGVVTAFQAPFDFKEDILDEIDSIAGYAGENANGEAVYTRGCLIIEYMYDGLTFYEVESWSGPSMSGPKGWTGEWTINN